MTTTRLRRRRCDCGTITVSRQPGRLPPCRCGRGKVGPRGTDHGARTVFSRTVHVPGTTVALLSRPTKMPGPSWSLPAGPACPFALYGEGTICGVCYADGAGNKRSRYAQPKVKHAQQVRFDWTRECMKTGAGRLEFTTTMAYAIIEANAGPYFRVHDSGDLFSPTYTSCWILVCQYLPQIHFWFPTRSWRAPWVDEIRRLAALPNVSVRPSALYLEDDPPVIEGLHAGTSVTAVGYSCPAPRQNGFCGECRTCWLSKDVEVSYHAH